MTKRNSRQSECIHCHKRTTYDPNRLVMVRHLPTKHNCLVKLYGILCAGCFRARTKVKSETGYPGTEKRFSQKSSLRLARLARLAESLIIKGCTIANLFFYLYKGCTRLAIHCHHSQPIKPTCQPLPTSFFKVGITQALVLQGFSQS